MLDFTSNIKRDSDSEIKSGTVGSLDLRPGKALLCPRHWLPWSTCGGEQRAAAAALRESARETQQAGQSDALRSSHPPLTKRMRDEGFLSLSFHMVDDIEQIDIITVLVVHKPLSYYVVCLRLLTVLLLLSSRIFLLVFTTTLNSHNSAE
jgi:hypothetical protein